MMKCESCKKEVKVEQGGFRVGNLIWSSELLAGGVGKTFEEWNKYCSEHGCRLPSLAEYLEMFKALDVNSDFAKVLKKDLRKYWLVTSTTTFNPWTEEVRAVGLGGDGFSNGVDNINANVNFSVYGRARAVVPVSAQKKRAKK